MKTIYLLLLLLPLWMVQPVAAQKLSKEEKAAQQAEAFQATKALIEGKQFKVEIDRVYPMGGKDVSRFNPRGKITVKDSIAEGFLPFFGRAYSLPYGEGGGIEFDNVMKDQEMKVIERKRKKSVIYSFNVTGKNDTYQIDIEVVGGNGCSVNLTSNNRTHISYSGRVSSLEKEK